MTYDNFIWEPLIYNGFRETVSKEIFEDRIYERVFEVEENDVVFDVGASLGPFTYSILDKNPSHVFAFEPSLEEFNTLVKNTRHGNVTQINKGISDKNGEFNFEHVFMNENHKLYSVTFDKVIVDYNIRKIDFIKTDCEGGEYDIFNLNNLFWIKSNVKKIAGEWHLSDVFLKNKFVEFRDVYLRLFPNYILYTSNGFEIDKGNVWKDEFVECFTEVMIYIDNR